MKKEDFARLDYYDQWLPALAPSQPIVSWALSQPWTDARWTKYVKDYRAEMSRPVPKQLIDLLAKMSHYTDFSVGCYCAEEARCHRSVLRELLTEHGADVV